MKFSPAAVVALLSMATPSFAQQSRPLEVEAGAVMGIVAVPYASVGVTRGDLLVRVSGGTSGNDCAGAQVNVGRVLRDEMNARHTVGLMWAGFRDNCWYASSFVPRKGGQYAGLAYDFQVKGFFLEVGAGAGARNPFLFEVRGPMSHVYGQVGYIHRFGKEYVSDDER
jgi:hypothetical protein